MNATGWVTTNQGCDCCARTISTKLSEWAIITTASTASPRVSS